MYDYDPPKNVNEYLHDVDVDVDMDVCLMYYEQLEDQAEQYTDPVHDTDAIGNCKNGPVRCCRRYYATTRA